MNRTIVFFAVTIMSLMLLCSCGGRGHEEEEHGDVLTMEQARQQEPQLMTTDEIVELVKGDTTHKKVVYWFDILCKPCRQHLQNEIASFYAKHDASEWRIYLVAGFNRLHRYVPDADGNVVEDANCISYYSAEYRKLLPSLVVIPSITMFFAWHIVIPIDPGEVKLHTKVPPFHITSCVPPYLVVLDV